MFFNFCICSTSNLLCFTHCVFGTASTPQEGSVSQKGQSYLMTYRGRNVRTIHMCWYDRCRCEEFRQSCCHKQISVSPLLTLVDINHLWKSACANRCYSDWSFFFLPPQQLSQHEALLKTSCLVRQQDSSSWIVHCVVILVLNIEFH